MACSLCHHDHKGPCYPNCPVCCGKPVKAVRLPGVAAEPVAKKSPAPKSSVKSTQAERNRRYREKNRERYNAYMREYRKRAKA